MWSGVYVSIITIIKATDLIEQSKKDLSIGTLIQKMHTLMLLSSDV